MYIANCTRSHFVFNVRVPERRDAFRIDIQSGHQKKFPIELNAAGKEMVIKQLERFGAVPAPDINSTVKRFGGVIYSLTKPISEQQILYANENQLDSAQTRSVEQATRSALAAELANRDNVKGKQQKRIAKSIGIEVLKKEAERGKEERMMDLEITDQANRSASIAGIH